MKTYAFLPFFLFVSWFFTPDFPEHTPKPPVLPLQIIKPEGVVVLDQPLDLGDRPLYVQAKAIRILEPISSQRKISLRATEVISVEAPLEAATISLFSTDTTHVNSSLSAKAGNAIHVFSQNIVHLDAQARLSAQGGEILVGGDYLGKGTHPTAQKTYLHPEASINADGVGGKDGGRIIVWSDNYTNVQGTLSARGSGEGKGGFIETSGKINLHITTTPDVSSTSGKGGEWLLDPRNVRIVGGLVNNNINALSPFNPTGDDAELGVGLIYTALALGDVTINTNTGGTQAGNITLDVNLDYNGIATGNTLTLNAENDIILNADILDSDIFISPSDNINVTLNAAGNITGAAQVIETRGGDITFNAGQSISIFELSTTNPTIASGAVSMSASDNISITNGTIDASNTGAGLGAGSVSVETTAGDFTSTNNLTILTSDANAGAVTLDIGGNITTPALVLNTSSNGGGAGADITISTGGTSTLNLGAVNSSGVSSAGDIDLNLGGGLTASGVITLSAGTGSGGNLDIEAQQDIFIANDITSDGGGADGGDISITSDQGNITTQALSSGGGAGNGGFISLAATNGIVTTGNLESSGTLSGASIGALGLSISTGTINSTGGNVDLEATSGTINSGSINTVNSGGGDVTLSALVSVTLPSIDANGFNQGGDVTINTDQLQVNAISANGTSTGAQGGSVSLNTTGDISTGAGDLTISTAGDVVGGTISIDTEANVLNPLDLNVGQTGGGGGAGTLTLDIFGPGTTTINGLFLLGTNGGGSLDTYTEGDIVFNTGIDTRPTGLGGAGYVYIDSKGDITFGAGHHINTSAQTGNNVTLLAAGGITVNDILTEGTSGDGGDIFMRSRGGVFSTIQVNGVLNTESTSGGNNGGNIYVRGEGNITVAPTNIISANSNTSIIGTGAGDVTFISEAGNIQLSAIEAVAVNGNGATVNVLAAGTIRFADAPNTFGYGDAAITTLGINGGAQEGYINIRHEGASFVINTATPTNGTASPGQLIARNTATREETTGSITASPAYQSPNGYITINGPTDIISITDGDWSNPTTWDCNCVPTLFDDVTVTHTVDLDINGAADNLTVSATGTLRHPPSVGSELLVRGDFNLEGTYQDNSLPAGELIVEGTSFSMGAGAAFNVLPTSKLIFDGPAPQTFSSSTASPQNMGAVTVLSLPSLTLTSFMRVSSMLIGTQLDADGNNIEVTGSGVVWESPGIFTPGGPFQTVTLNGGGMEVVESSFMNLTIGPGTTAVDFTGDIGIAGTLIVADGPSLDLGTGVIELSGAFADNSTGASNITAGVGSLFRFVGSGTQVFSAPNLATGPPVFYDVEVAQGAGSGGVTLTSSLLIDNELTLTNGVVRAPITGELVGVGWTNPGLLSGGSPASYIEGTIFIGDLEDDVTLPVGNAGIYAPVQVSNLSGATDLQVNYVPSRPTKTGTTPSVENISLYEYWNIAQVGTESMDITLAYNNAAPRFSGVTDPANLIIAKSNATGVWATVAGSGPGSGTPSGNITATNVTPPNTATFGDETRYTLADNATGSNFNPLFYVDQSATAGTNSGLSWTNAFLDLQSALDIAQAGDSIVVASGTYTPSVQYNFTTGLPITGNPRAVSFKIPDGVILLGGWAGGEAITPATVAARNITANQTTLSGDVDGTPDAVAGGALPLLYTGYGANAYHVVFTDGVTSATVVDGFTVRSGNATLGTDGGGWYNRNGSPSIRNITFLENIGQAAGAITNDGSGAGTASPVFENCIFSRNSAGLSGGGAVFNNGSGGTASPTYINCLFTQNYTSGDGGAVLSDGTTGASLPDFTNCTFYGNQADGEGGALRNQNGAVATIRNSIFWQNTAASGGVSWDNSGLGFADIAHTLVSETAGTYPNTTFGANVIYATDPLFTAPTSGDFTLQNGSPAIDWGDAAPLPVGTATDLGGNPRVQGLEVDLGAYESPFTNLSAIPSAPIGNRGVYFDRALAQVTTTPTFNALSAFTYEVWIKPQDLSTTAPAEQHFMSHGTARALYIRNADDLIVFDIDGTTITSDDPLTQNKWTHVAATFDGTNLELYIDGIQQSGSVSLATLPSTPANELSLGSGSFPGQLDEAKVWNLARNASEVVGGINDTTKNATGLIAYWDFEAPSGSVANDRQLNTIPVNNGSLSLNTLRAFRVTDTNDDAVGGIIGSFSWAIDTANAFPDKNYIDFSIAATGTQVIQPTNPFIPVTGGAVIIDGFSQLGSSPNTRLVGDNAVRLIVLDGSSTGGGEGINLQSSNNFIRGLEIRNFIVDGIQVSAGGSNNTFEGCFSHSNGSDGLDLVNSGNDQIGGTLPAARNIFSGNGDSGLHIQNSDNVRVENNYMGVNPDGITAFPNAKNGLELVNGQENSLITNNVMSANTEAGIFLSGSMVSENNIIRRNLIGVGANRSTLLGNAVGVWIATPNNGVQNTVIGGVVAGAGNAIVDNGIGVFVAGGATSTTSRNRIRGNSMRGNTIGISLGNPGVTPNDLGDGDTGPNNLQNFPAISSAELDGTSLSVSFAVPSGTGNSLYPLTIDFYLSDGNRQGQTYLGSTTYTSAQAGTVVDATISAPSLAVGDQIVATATDADGNTSEFSRQINVTSSGIDLIAVIERTDPASCGGSANMTLSVLNLRSDRTYFIDPQVSAVGLTSLDTTNMIRVNPTNLSAFLNRLQITEGLPEGMLIGPKIAVYEYETGSFDTLSYTDLVPYLPLPRRTDLPLSVERNPISKDTTAFILLDNTEAGMDYLLLNLDNPSDTYTLQSADTEGGTLRFRTSRLSDTTDFTLTVTNPLNNCSDTLREATDTTALRVVTVEVTNSVRESDSLALIELYEELGGGEWLPPWPLNRPIAEWEGVTVFGGCITRLDLRNRGLRGILPVRAILELSCLEFLDISENYLDFASIEPILFADPGFAFVYAPQEQVREPLDTMVAAPNRIVLQTRVGGSLNRYQWYFNEELIPGATRDSLVLDPTSEENIGTYTAEITNTIATLLTLERHPINLDVIPQLDPSDSLWLVALYESLGGTDWLNTWDLEQPISTWYGLRFEEGELVEISLQNNNLSGELPDIFNIDTVALSQRIQIINLSGNDLFGQLPASIAELEDLQYLDLSHNAFSGNIPESYGNLTNLTTLWLSHNQLTGLPENIQWENLRNLFLNGNRLTTLPESLSNAAKLRVLDISDNPISSIPATALDLPELREFYANNMGLLELPAIVAQSRFLEIIEIISNELAALPEGLRELAFLRILKMGDNRFDFGDIEPLLDTVEELFEYAPQAPINTALDTVVASGARFTMRVQTEGRSNTYQWFRNGIPVRGATQPDYTIEAMSAAQVGVYTCEVTNERARALVLRRRTITLSLACAITDVEILSESTGIFCEGGENSATLTAPEGNYSYQWYFNGTPLFAATNRTYSTNRAGSYRVELRDLSGCKVISEPFVLETIPAPDIRILPSDTLSGQLTYLSFGSVPVAFQWYFEGEAIPDATEGTLRVVESGEYYLEVTDANGCTGESNRLFFNLTGLDDTPAALETKLYPNPTDGSLLILELPAEAGALQRVILTDNLGRVLQEVSVKPSSADSGRYRLEGLQTLPAGAYYLKVETEAAVLLKELMLR